MRVPDSTHLRVVLLVTVVMEVAVVAVVASTEAVK
jgi:hypothetical protein